MLKITEEDVRRFAEVARSAGLRVDEEARQSVPEGKPSDFHFGFVSGIACAVAHCRSFAGKLDEKIERELPQDEQTLECRRLVLKAVELIIMRMAPSAAVAAELCIEVQKDGGGGATPPPNEVRLPDTACAPLRETSRPRT